MHLSADKASSSLAELLDEVDSAKGEACYEDLEPFPFAATVLKETLRLQGASAFFSRIAMKDTQVRLSECAYLKS